LKIIRLKRVFERLKKASDELGLEPIGFLVSAESIVNLLQKDEGAPVTAVLVEMGQKFITVSVYQKRQNRRNQIFGNPPVGAFYR